MAGKRELRIFMAIGRHLWTLHNKMERRNEALPIAIVVGVHPLFSLGAQAFTPSTDDEYAVIGGMMNEPLRVVKAKTVPVLVPADAELIIEGKILPNVRREEGPFGEFTGHAVSKDERPVIEVTAITHRKNYIFQDVHAGYTEHKLMGAVPREAALIRAVRQTVPTVKNVCMPVSGNCRFHAYISIAKRGPGQAKNAICAAFASDMLLKHVVIVDDDIDVFDEEQVLWAVSNRFQADKDLVVIANAQGSELDPSAGPGGVNAKMGLDATKPLTGFAPELRVPDEVMRKIRLEDFLPTKNSVRGEGSGVRRPLIRPTPYPSPLTPYDLPQCYSNENLTPAPCSTAQRYAHAAATVSQIAMPTDSKTTVWFSRTRPGNFSQDDVAQLAGDFLRRPTAVGDHRHVGLARRFAAEQLFFPRHDDTRVRHRLARQLPAGDGNDQRARFDPFRFDHWSSANWSPS